MPMQKRAAACGEHMVDRSGERLASAGASIGLAVIGPDDRIEYCNAQYLKLWGIPALSLAGGFGGLEPDIARSLMNAVLFRQDAIRTRNTIRLGDGRSLELVTVSARDAAGAGVRRVTFVRDVTEAQASRGGLLERALAGLAGALVLVVASLAVTPQPGHGGLAAHESAFALASVDRGQAH